MYISVKEAAEKWLLSERAVRKYCAENRIPGVVLQGKTWQIPEEAQKPERKLRTVKPNTLLKLLQLEKKAKIGGSVYHMLQIEMTYNSNHMEGSRLTYEQTRFIFETKTIGLQDVVVSVDDIIETTNHFRAIDYIIDNANTKLTESYIKRLHFILKNGTSDGDKAWFGVGEYKRLQNEVGGRETTAPEKVASAMRALLDNYHKKSRISLEDIVTFHAEFERIHPFQDGNGRVGRLIMLKECLKHNIVPFVITEELKLYYYRGLQEWQKEQGFLLGTCEEAQDRFKRWLPDSVLLETNRICK